MAVSKSSKSSRKSSSQKKPQKTSRKSQNSTHKKKARKNQQLKSKSATTHKFIRSGSVLEKINETLSHLTPNKRKLLAEVSNALMQNTSSRRIRISLLPKVMKPKRPMTGYMLFTHENRDRVQQEHPEMKITQLAKFFGQEWKALSEEEQASYKSRKVTNTRVPVSTRMDPKLKAQRCVDRMKLRALAKQAK